MFCDVSGDFIALLSRTCNLVAMLYDASKKVSRPKQACRSFKRIESTEERA